MNAKYARVVVALLLLGVVGYGVVSTSKETAPEPLPTVANSIEQAKLISKAENKPLIIFFTGSDWCVWCQRLEKEMSNPVWSSWVKDNAILYTVDNTRKVSTKRQEVDKLVKDFKVETYPTLFILAPGGTHLYGKVGYSDASTLVKNLKSLIK